MYIFIYIHIVFVFAYFLDSVCNGGIIGNGPKSIQCKTVKWTKGGKNEKKYKRKVKGHSLEMAGNGGNKGNTCLGSAGLLDLHDVNASWSRTCQESVISPTTKQVDVDSRWCEVWWYVNTVLEDPHHASKWVFSYWYFDYTDYSFGIISSQHLPELERTFVRCQT